ncbi:Alpha-2-macroglobulin family protein [Bacteroidales bacterium WCE2004]|nr:Alpha-2-macroglobulin family protein [Bacteroidales bacterium WCE2004]
MRAIRLITLALLTLMNLPHNACAQDKAGHILTRLWADYEKAENDDRPQDQVRILEQIKKEATDKHLARDFYDACIEYADVREEINWKDRDAVRKQTDEEMERFGEPIVLFCYRMEEYSYENYHVVERRLPGLLAYVQEHRAQMERSHNPTFYEQYGWSSCYKVIGSLIKNDYEYALCALLYEGPGGAWARQVAGAFPPQSYPFDALLEFIVLKEDESADDAYEKYAADHAGQAVALLARDRLLRRRIDGLKSKDTSSQEEYLQLARDCEALQADCKKFSGKEKDIADCCSEAGQILTGLNQRAIWASVNKGTVTLRLRNLPQARVTVVKQYGDDKKPVFERLVANTRRSFYVEDEFVFDLPDIDDGSYILRCEEGKTDFETRYEKYTLSLALKRDYDGYGVYVADYVTGEPVSSCDILLLRNGKQIDMVKGLPIDGFTYLPERFAGWLGNTNSRYSYSVQATLVKDGRKHSSRQEGFYYRPRETENTNTPIRHAAILTDRSAFNPGETVQFKVILYEGTYEYATRPEAIRLHATLTDPSGKVIGESNLVTGEFGSAAGSFVLKKGERGGMYTIDVSEGGKQIASTRVRADEFVLPTFTLNWEPDRRSYLPQDNVTVRGNVKSYSGHSLGTATARYTVVCDGETLAEGPLALEASGDFDIRFTAPAETDDYFSGSHVNIRVTITDSTGETLSYNKWLSIINRLSLSVDIRNQVAGEADLASSPYGGILVGDDFIRAWFKSGDEVSHPTLKITYKVLRGATTLLSGEAPDGQPVDLSLAGLPSGLYTVEGTATARSDIGKEYTQTTKCMIIKCSDSDTALDLDARSFFKELPDDGKGIALQIGTTTGPAWVVAELYGDGNRLLEKRMVRLAGIRGQAGSLETVRFARKPGYPETLTLSVFWFRNENAYNYTFSSYKAAEPFQLPLGFSRFLDTTLPHTDYQFTIRTGAGTEVAATIFDKSTETIQPNNWQTFVPSRRTLPRVFYSQTTGTNGSSGYGPVVRHMAATKSTTSNAAIYGATAPAEDFDLAESVSLAEAADQGVVVAYGVQRKSDLTGSVAGVNGSAPAIRTDFASTVAWEPFLRADDNGEVTFRFTTADKLSTYYVQLFAHDKAFHNATLRQEMVVTLPVKVALVQPQYLYEGDRYVARVTVANSLDTPVSGRINVCFLDGKDHKTAPLVAEEEQAVTVPAGGSADFSCAISAPAVADLGLLVSFVADQADYGSDAVFVTLPVKPAVQTITEAHSALMLSWMDREAILTALRGQFVNVPGTAASLREISILDMIREAIPEKVLPTSDNLLAQSEALFANCLLDRLPDAKGSAATAEQRAEMCAKILACRNEDGGFGWFAEMRSSPLLTSVLLERLAAMGDACPQQLRDAIPAAVKYLDATYFGDAARPLWCGGISLDQYLHTRSLFPEVAFAPKADAKVLREFKKAAKAYLVPGSKRGLNGQVFAKARRMKTLRALLQSEAGAALARDWGVSLFARRRLARSLDKDVASLLQYAVPHQSGGTYYPNAVMPWRGLLESELYAHTLICNLLTDCGHSEVAEGIRLWTMVQKETQQWADDPAYIEAIDCVLRGSEETLQTRVLALSATTTLPLRQVKAAGNGFTVSRTYTRDGKPLQDGDVLHVGDRIQATYQIWNEENRSFVRLSVPRPAAFRPVEQRSGRLGWSGRPISITGWVVFSPQGYRSVLADRTEFWFDSYPEENTTLVEEFFVTQEGTFQSPVPEIESLYAPHYRANDAGHPAVVVAP